MLRIGRRAAVAANINASVILEALDEHFGDGDYAFDTFGFKLRKQFFMYLDSVSNYFLHARVSLCYDHSTVVRGD
jgi:hypothetical protein